MGNCESLGNSKTASPLPKNIEKSSFTCTYNVIKDNSYVQIISGIYNNNLNKEIETKVKILNNGKIENLCLKKKFAKKGLYSIDFIIEGNLTDMGCMFNNFSALKSIKFISLDTSQVINMKGMFQNCKELENLDLSNFDTSNVTNMKGMFNKCNKLKEIRGINNFNTIKVINMEAMFQEYNELEYLDLSNFDTSNVKNMTCMFNKCRKL